MQFDAIKYLLIWAKIPSKPLGEKWSVPTIRTLSSSDKVLY